MCRSKEKLEKIDNAILKFFDRGKTAKKVCKRYNRYAGHTDGLPKLTVVYVSGRISRMMRRGIITREIVGK